MSILPESVARRCDFSSRVVVLLLAVCLPLTTSGFEIVLAVAAVAWLGSGSITDRMSAVLRNRVAVLSLVLWGLFALGATFGSATAAEAWRGLMKYRELLCIPLLLSLFQKPDWERLEKIWDVAWLIRAYRRWDPSGVLWRRWGLMCLVAGTLVSVAGSYVEWIVGRDIGFQARNDNVVFMDRIVQNLLVVFVIYVLAYRAMESRRWWWAYAGTIGLAFFSLFALVPGRTGYLVLAALIGLLMWQRFKVRGLVVATAAVCLLAAGAYFASPMFRTRMQQTAVQARQYWSGTSNHDALSPNVEPRLKYYELTLRLIRRSPIVGHGTGGFERGYREFASPAGLPVPAEPHNEYLAIASQIGLIGLAVWLWMLLEQWKAAKRLPLPDQHFAQALLLLMVVGCLANSLLHSHTIGMTFAYLTALLFAGDGDPPAIQRATFDESHDVGPRTLGFITTVDATCRAA
jgi:O-antigen ligase